MSIITICLTLPVKLKCFGYLYSDGIVAPSHITTVKFDDIVDTLNTGDLVLFSGATTSGALIKLFDNAEFSHIGIVSSTAPFLRAHT